MEKITAKHIDTLRHMLGIHGMFYQKADLISKDKKPYRNHYVSNGDEKTIKDLVSAGLIEKYANPTPTFNYYIYRCTPEGKRVVFESITNNPRSSHQAGV